MLFNIRNALPSLSEDLFSTLVARLKVRRAMRSVRLGFSIADNTAMSLVSWACTGANCTVVNARELITLTTRASRHKSTSEVRRTVGALGKCDFIRCD